MNVDDAMEAAKAYRAAHEQEQEPLYEAEEVAITLLAEVERLRAWNIRWRDVSVKLRLTLVELSEELAAAKAASVVPVRVLGIYETEYPSDCYIEFRTGDDCGKFRDWIRDRMKERGEG